MAVQRQGNVKGRAPSGHANQHAKLGCKEPITLILGQAPSVTNIFTQSNNENDLSATENHI